MKKDHLHLSYLFSPPRMEPLSCDEPVPWSDGEKVLSYLKEVEQVGLTGEIKFDADGYRTDFQLDLMEKVRLVKGHYRDQC